MQTFVTIHDQDLLLACEEEGRFADLADVTYLFVGPRPVDKVPRETSIVVCRDYSDNIECWPAFYDFTGWWVLARHDLIRTERVMFLQYDMRSARPDLEHRVAELLLSGDDMVAFVAGHRSAHNWMLLLSGFEDAFRAGLAVRGATMHEAWPWFEEWPTTQGTAWNRAAFVGFMMWIRPMLDDWAGNVWAGHLAERTVKAWLANHDRSNGFLIGGISHEGRDCHGTCALMGGRADIHAERAATFGVAV